MESIIHDADFSTDIDDVGALAMLHALADLGECDILGMMVSSTNGASPGAMDVINHYYRRPDIPIGVRPGMGGGGGYSGTLIDEFPHRITSAADCPAAVTLYRQLLAAAPDASVTIVTAGYLTNLKALLQSAADGISPLTGSALIAQKVKVWVAMGGAYPTGNEFNFVTSGDDSAFVVVNNWPSAATFCGSEVGGALAVGGGLTATPTSNPVRRAYQVFNGITDGAAYDETAVYEAVRPSGGLFGHQTVGHNTVTSSAGENVWVASPDPSGTIEQKYLLQVDAAAAEAVFEALLTAPPTAPRRPAGHPHAFWSGGQWVRRPRSVID